MQEITHNIALNLSQPNNFEYIHIMQGDYNAEKVIATLFDGNKLYTINAQKASLQGSTSDGGLILQDGITISADKHQVTFEITKEMSSCTGELTCNIVFSSDNQKKSTFPFIIKNTADITGRTPVSVLTTISDYVDRAEKAASDAEKTLKDKADKDHKHTKSDITDFPTSMPASDVSPWAKASKKPTYSKSEVGLGNVDNTADSAKSVKYATSAGSASSASKATGVVDYGSTGKTIQIGYGGDGISGDAIKFIAGYTTGNGSDVNAKIKDISKDNLKSWLGLGSLAYSSATIPTSLPANGGNSSTVNGHTVNSNVPANAKFTDTVYSHPTSSGNKHIPSGGSSGQILRWAADGTATWGSDNNTIYNTGTTSVSGLTKLYTGTGSSTDGTMPQSAITSALNNKAPSSHTHDYLPLSGGTVNGPITFGKSDSYGIFTSTDNYCSIGSSSAYFYRSYIKNVHAN